MKMLKNLVFFSLFLFVLPFSFSQNNTFPQGSTQGTTDMQTRQIQPAFPTIPNVDINITQPTTGRQMAFSVQVLILLTILTLAPSLLILLTCFLRFSIVLDFIKRALSLQQVPPTAVLNGIAFFMTLFIMWPTFNRIYTDAFKPMSSGQIEFQEAFSRAQEPIRTFMLKQMPRKDSKNNNYIAMFLKIAGIPQPRNANDLPTYILVPAYILNELTIAFKIGVLLYIPFIIIDMVVASILMSMGMMMLPPVQISMPFKLMLFVLVDGWGLLTQQLFASIVQ